MQIEGLQTVHVGPEDATLRRKSLTGRFPVLEDGEGGGIIITDSLPIARYLTRENAMFNTGSCLDQSKSISITKASAVPSLITNRLLL